MGKIAINKLRMQAHHGVFEQERRVGNEFEVNITLNVPSSDAAMQTDSLNDTINYAEVVEIVKREMEVPSKLLEHVAGRIQRALLEHFGDKITSGSISVAKLAPPIAAQIGSVAYTVDF